MHVKKDVKDLDAIDLDLPAGTKPYINDSLCTYYSGLWNETKKQWNNFSTRIFQCLIRLNIFLCVHIINIFIS